MENKEIHRLLYMNFHRKLNFRNVLSTGNWHLIPTDRVPAVAMNGWHVARHWAAGIGASPAAQ